MLGRMPRIPHGLMRWLIITLLLLNGGQLVLLQGAINSSALGQVGTTWTYVLISALILLLALALIGYAFLRDRQSRS
jgi:membrane protein implicated in regulation of membrane protease activity